MNKKASNIELLYSKQLAEKNLIIAEQAKEIEELKNMLVAYDTSVGILNNKLDSVNDLVNKLNAIIPKF